MNIKSGDKVYYQDYFGVRRVGTVLSVRDNGDFSVSGNPNTGLPQMDDTYRLLSPSDEGKLFGLYPTPEFPIPIEAQIKMQGNNE